MGDSWSWILTFVIGAVGLVQWLHERRLDALEAMQEKHRGWLEKVAQMHVDRIDDQAKTSKAIRSMVAVLDATHGRRPSEHKGDPHG